ncbi:type III secretion system export apparatus subunit SctR [bacterium]|nr:type III secretion system export apparatus subunit SctR [candidate division CSSED10-310 bacterium]
MALVTLCATYLLFSPLVSCAVDSDAPGLSQRPVLLLISLAGLALVPFLLIMVTSFLKLSVVFSIVRSALGTHQIPPNQVLIGLALILSIHIMMPVATDIYGAVDGILRARTVAGAAAGGLGDMDLETLTELFEKGRRPLEHFLFKNSHLRERNMFLDLGRKMRSKEERTGLVDKDFSVLVPAFVISELKEAFQIGFLVFLPFLVIDMVVANILMAMGMFMLSPTQVSLPFKLLLFVLVDGWHVLSKGLIMGYL